MPNPLSLSDAADLIDVSIQEIWLKGSETESRLFEQYYHVESGVTDYYLKDSSISGLGYAGRIVENAAITAASPVQGYDRTFTQVQFGVILSFTKPMYSKGLHRPLVTMVNKLLKLQGNLTENICSQIRDIKKSLKGSETIIGAPTLVG